MPKHSKKKKKKKPSVSVELRAGGDPHRPEKLGWSAGDMRQWPKKEKKNAQHPVPRTGVLQKLGSGAAIQEASIQKVAI